MIDESNVTITKNRHLGWKIGLFIGGILIVVTLIVLYAVGAFSSSAGYVNIDAIAERDLPYGGEYTCRLYFEGNNLAINSQKKAASETYSSALKKAYLETEDTYIRSGVTSIANVNQALGKSYEVDEGTYGLLQRFDGYAKAHGNYSLYASPLYAEWNRLSVVRSQLSDPSQDVDPAVNQEEADYLASLAKILADPSSVKLEFLENRNVRLTISEEYAAFRKDNGIDSPILSLGHLRYAYCIEAAASALEEAGFRDGLIRHEYGLGISLSQTPSLAHSLYGANGGKVENPGLVNLEGGYSFAKYVRYNVGQTLLPIFYSLTHEGKTHYRSPYLDLKEGRGNEYHHLTYLFDKKKGLVETALLAQDCLGLTSEGEWEALLPSLSEVECVYVGSDNPTCIKVSPSLKEKVVLSKPNVYSVESM